MPKAASVERLLHLAPAGFRFTAKLQKQFDFDYREEELREWTDGLIPRMAARAAQGVAFFNNHVRGQATRNAKQLMRLLGAAA